MKSQKKNKLEGEVDVIDENQPTLPSMNDSSNLLGGIALPPSDDKPNPLDLFDFPLPPSDENSNSTDEDLN